ncbi:hypothetical protein [Krasilnikovia sp. MM14-A1004]|uniref:hypothetical protein n=1 Tax=Krasilnikovia sp. MM14-A1004 TaxID=3373541 RepID=UPI00399D287F
MRLAKRLAGLVLATAMVAVGGFAVPASAAAKHHQVLWVTPVMKIKDDEVGQDDNRTWSLWTHVIEMPAGDTLLWENCAGAEARGRLELTIKPVPGAPGQASIGISVHLYEGASCATKDLENSEIRVFTMQPNTTSEQHIHVRTRETCGGVFNRHRCNDYVDVKFAISNEYK